MFDVVVLCDVLLLCFDVFARACVRGGRVAFGVGLLFEFDVFEYFFMCVLNGF